MDSPGYDPASVTGQIAGGCNLVCFTTGRGSAFGSKPAPTIKVATNSEMYARMTEDMDVNAGTILTEGVSVEEKGREIYEMFLRVASGEPVEVRGAGPRRLRIRALADRGGDVSDARLIVDAARTAAEAHAGQLRKGTSGAPYINHPIAVAQMVAGETDDAEVIAAALLHDVVEDSETGVADLRSRFGARVAEIVAELSDDPEIEALPRPERKRLQAEHIAGASREAKLIKIADQTCNLEDLAREPAIWPPDDHANYRVGAQKVVDACRDVSTTLAARFDRAVEAHARAVQAMEERTWPKP